MKYYRFRSPFDYLKRIFRATIYAISITIVTSSLVLEIFGIQGLLFLFLLYIIIVHLTPLLFQPISLEIDNNSITINHIFSTETFFIKNLEILQQSVVIKYFGAKKRLLIKSIDETKKFIIYDYWSDYKAIINQLFRINLLDPDLEDHKAKMELDIRKSIIYFTIAIVILMIITCTIIMIVVKVSDKSLPIIILSTSLIFGILPLIYIRKNSKFKEYRKMINAKSKSM